MTVTDLSPADADELKDLLDGAHDTLAGDMTDRERFLWMDLRHALYTAARRPACQTNSSAPPKPAECAHCPRSIPPATDAG